MNTHEVCPRCNHFSTCRAPCYPVAEYLKADNLSVFERSHTDPETGQTTTILFSRSREMVESDLPQVSHESGDHTTKEIQDAFNTENENPFAGFNPHLKKTGIFVDRFFHGFSYQDIATKYDLTVDTAQSTYAQAVQRVLEILELMDQQKPLDLSYYKRKMEQRSGRLPKDQRYFLLNKVFGVMPSEIAKMEGLKGSSSVRELIIRVSDQLRAGEIRLLDMTPESTATEEEKRHAAALARRRAKYHRNIEASRAKQRQRYREKKHGLDSYRDRKRRERNHMFKVD